MQGIDKTLAMIMLVPSTVLFSWYNVYFNANFGGTVGKLIMKIRIVKPDGRAISYVEAFKRSSIDLIFGVISLLAQLYAIAQVDALVYTSATWIERPVILQEFNPAWFGAFILLQHIWVWSELIVILFNKRKRAIHDFIAGTIVVNKEFV